MEESAQAIFDQSLKDLQQRQADLRKTKPPRPAADLLPDIPVQSPEELAQSETLRESEERERQTHRFRIHVLNQVPRKYRDAHIRDLPRELVDAVPWGRVEGIYLPGNVSIGKTHAATALARYALRPNSPIWNGDEAYYGERTFRWVSTPYLMARIRSTMGRLATEREIDVIDDLAGCRVLILDDLGAENVTDFSAATVYTLISRRINDARLTLITSNQNEDQIQTWEARIAARLDEFHKIILPDIDRRALATKVRETTA